VNKTVTDFFGGRGIYIPILLEWCGYQTVKKFVLAILTEYRRVTVTDILRRRVELSCVAINGPLDTDGSLVLFDHSWDALNSTALRS